LATSTQSRALAEALDVELVRDGPQNVTAYEEHFAAPVLGLQYYRF
jgi:hypothetical protein